ncbi:MAG: hypothetical protein IT379_23630 [Deltaproteobacteria bacterium]|nr:hypothetical protein [Deltaproteobacteria bacterium]
MAATNTVYNATLSAIATAYAPGHFIADEVCKTIIVDSPAGRFQKLSRADTTTPYDAERAENGEARELDWSVAPDTYLTVDYANKVVTSQKQVDAAAKSGSPLRPLEQAAERVKHNLWLLREIRVATMYQTAGNYAAGYSVNATAVWSNTSTGVPVSDIDSARALLPPTTGESELVLIVSLEAAQAMRKHPNFIGAGALRPVASMDEMASILGVDRVLVTDAQKNTANPGQAVSHSRIWDRTKAVLTRVPKSEFVQGDRVEGFCATFRFPIDGAGSEIGVRQYDWQIRGQGGSVIVEAEHSDADKVLMSDQAVLINAVLA